MNTEKRRIGPVTQSSGIGAAVGIVLAYVVNHYLLPGAPEAVQDAAVVILLFAGLTIGGWLVRPGTGDHAAR